MKIVFPVWNFKSSVIKNKSCHAFHYQHNYFVLSSHLLDTGFFICLLQFVFLVFILCWSFTSSQWTQMLGRNTERVCVWFYGVPGSWSVKLSRLVDAVNRNANLCKILASSPLFEIIPVEYVALKKNRKKKKIENKKPSGNFLEKLGHFVLWPLCESRSACKTVSMLKSLNSSHLLKAPVFFIFHVSEKVALEKTRRKTTARQA